jgi:pyruvate carboxylase
MPKRTSWRCTGSRPTKPISSGKGKGPVEAYLQIDEYIRVARISGADAIHPGYGLLSESPEFADACADAGITFIGPERADHARPGQQGRRAQHGHCQAGVPVVPATEALARRSRRPSKKMAAEAIGYPLMLKAILGRGRARHAAHHRCASSSCFRGVRGQARGQGCFRQGRDVSRKARSKRARHVEVQLLGDAHGNLVHLYERDCSVQRRNQKVVERAPAPYLDDEATRKALTDAALRFGQAANYRCAGTVEFLMDADNRPSSTSSRSIRASRSNTRSPKR